MSHKQESHVRLMGPHPISVKCYGSTAVSKTASLSSTLSSGAILSGCSSIGRVLGLGPRSWEFESLHLDHFEKAIYMTEEQLKRQAIFRLTVFFLLSIVIGFVLSDLNIHSQLSGDNQNVQDFRGNQDSGH